MNKYNPLQLREIFHLEFLRWLGKKINPSYYALKGGVNLRFFYNSFRYSEDVDLNARIIQVDALRDKVMQILKSIPFQNNLKPFGIDKIVPPDIAKAKQTQTTQRFKIHLITPQNENFFTKIEFSRREFKNNIKIETVSNAILREYKLAPVLIPHYNIISAISQKLDALAARKITQARDAFDIYILISQIESSDKEKIKPNLENIKKARENAFEISFEQFKDTVVSYLLKEDQKIYNSPLVWDEIKLKVINFIEELKK
ncbi:nucleotidyl transferase AbiEii/AbiGii toxin family protein [Patescibacteria group bacterium]|nr:nucleotidyl transferase AbiEii/AbiGii toxin family protein [Patescibacteria group bacterium]